MKKNYILTLALLLSFSIYSQNNNTDFEDLTLPTNSYWNGSDQSGMFISKTVNFKNKYDTAWGGSWSGVSYSNMNDDTTAGFSNQFSCIAKMGYDSSQNFAVFNPNSDTLVTIPNYGRFNGFWINNSTYAYLSMKNGDSFAKKFGDSLSASGTNDGTNGNDWFKLTIYGNYSDSVEFYLADFRGPSSTDYIIKDWTYVSLSSLNPNSKHLTFKMSSSDVGRYGMNTPKYFCMDNLSYSTYTLIPEIHELSISMFPNPTHDIVNFNFDKISKTGNFKIMDMSGRIISSSDFSNIIQLKVDLSQYEKGSYLIVFEIDSQIIMKKIIKQ